MSERISRPAFISWWNTSAFRHLIAFVLVAILSCCIYLPFLRNGLIFDDQPFFASPIFDFAQHPISLSPRAFPYFTLGIVQVLSGSIEAHRLVSLALHIACGWLVYFFCFRATGLLLSASRLPGQSVELPTETAWPSSVAASLLFVAHPAAAYGSGYLVQRSIVFATIFCLISALLFLRAIREERIVDCLSAALVFSAAVMCKEHAVLLPLALTCLILLAGYRNRFSAKATLVFLICCFPAAFWATIASRTVLGSVYEPDATHLHAYVNSPKLVANSQWLSSAISQMGYFFDYVRTWLAPDISKMSIDVRPPEQSTPILEWATPRIVAFLSVPFATSLMAIHYRGRARIIAAGLIYVWSMYLVELATVRVQEPFVIYRSFLWAPGFALIATGIALHFPKKLLIALCAFLVAGGVYASRDRLASMTSMATVWADAAEKLSSENVPGAGRIYYNRGVDSLRQAKYQLAIEDFNRALREYPDVGQIYYERGVARFSVGDFNASLNDFDSAVARDQQNGAFHFGRGMVFEKLQQMEQAREAYQTASDLGVLQAQLKLHQLSK